MPKKKNLEHTIVIDTREQKPYTFGNEHFIRDTLPYGDYSLMGMEKEIAIERKSLNDFIGSITTGRKRFEKNIKDAIDNTTYYAVVIESDLPRIWKSKSYSYSKLPPKVIVATATKWSVKYNIPIFFGSNRYNSNYITRMLIDGYNTYKQEGRLIR